MNIKIFPFITLYCIILGYILDTALENSIKNIDMVKLNIFQLFCQLIFSMFMILLQYTQFYF